MQKKLAEIYESQEPESEWNEMRVLKKTKRNIKIRPTWSSDVGERRS